MRDIEKYQNYANAWCGQRDLEPIQILKGRKTIRRKGSFNYSNKKNPFILLNKPNLSTLVHELIHYELWYKGLPYGHGKLFNQRCKEENIKGHGYKYKYVCPICKCRYFSHKNINLTCKCNGKCSKIRRW